ncbi:MAG: hypothetical protein U0231_18885 [Nitrospiraceae bacterium]
MPIATWENAIVDLGGGWDAYFARQTGHHRKRAKKELQILESLGRLAFDRYDAPEQVEAYLDPLPWHRGAELESAAWRVAVGAG